jgi:hypothetical protein
VNTYYRGMECLWNQAQAASWQAFHEAARGAMQQSWRYGEALAALGSPVHRAWLVDEQGPAGIAQFVCRRFAGYLSLGLCSRGPLWRQGLPAASRREFYRLMRASLPLRPLRVALFSPEQVCLPDAKPEETLGMRRVMTGYSTVLIDLERPAEERLAALEPKWRNRLRRAQAEKSLQIFINANRARCDWLLEREREQRQSRRFFGLPTGFVASWIDRTGNKDGPAFALGRADQAGQTVAAMLFLIHGRTATYHIGWADELGRELNAHNRILWEAFDHLRAQGVTQLDLGGVNTRDLPGISRFKLGTGGTVWQLCGTYL